MQPVVLLIAFVIAALLDPLCAQAPFPIREGSEIRIETNTDRVFRGTVLGGSPDSIRLRQVFRDSVVAVPLLAVQRYSVRRADRRSGAKRGFLIGGSVALGVVALLTAANANREDLSLQIGLISAVPVALVGGGLGATVGAALAPATWGESVRLHASRTGPVSLGLTRRF